MRTVTLYRFLSIGFLFCLTQTSWATDDGHVFDKGFAIGIYTSLEWISQPIPTDFSQPQFHQGVYKIRKGQAIRLISITNEQLASLSDRDLMIELERVMQLLEYDIGKPDIRSLPWIARVALLNEALEKARQGVLRYIVNNYEDASLDASHQLVYHLEAEDLHGFYYGLQILGQVQLIQIFELSDPFYFSFIDLWYLANSFQSTREVLMNRLPQTQPNDLRPATVGLKSIIKGLHNLQLLELYVVLQKIERQWRSGNHKSLQIKKEDKEYKAIVSQVKNMLGTSQIISRVLSDQLAAQRRNLQLSMQSCVDLLKK